VVGRELIFSDPEIAELITGRFVPYAGDQWYLHRQQDEEGRYFWKVAQQGHYARRPMDQTRQGIYVATPDGQLLASDHFRAHRATFLAMLRRGLAAAPGKLPAPDAATPDPRFRRTPPEGGLVLKVFTRIPLPAGAAWSPNQAVGRDHVWITREEAATLAPRTWRRGEASSLPPRLAERLVRFHLLDNVRGEPPMWSAGHIRESDLTLRVADPAAGRLTLTGTARLASNDGRRGYDARLQGELRLDRATGRWEQVDLLAWGDAWGEGPYTRGAPPGRFPLRIAFSKAGDRPTDRVPPQGSRDYGDYFGRAR